MLLVSLISLRLSNPRTYVILLSDTQSYNALHKTRKDILDFVDELINIETPEGTPTFKNRWIKTQINKYVQGSNLYLDADTIIRKSIEHIPNLVQEFGGVSNENRSSIKDQGCSLDFEVFDFMGWKRDFPVYVNGGVWFYKSSHNVAVFFDLWHQYWSASSRSIGRFQDQPSLNKAIMDSNIVFSELPSKFNFQLSASWCGASEAAIWHFYSSI
jgi:hypothetical protein